MIIGITGSFGSGKTTVSNIFKTYGFKVVDVDRLYHDDFYKNHPLREKIKKEFGTLDRNKLKNIVFADYSKLKKLNRITHPLIIKAMKKEIQRLKNANKKRAPIIKKFNIQKNKKIKSDKNPEKTINKKNSPEVKIVVDVPLLFEAKIEKLFERIIVVKCDKKTQISRILKKKKYSKKEIEQIIKSQMPLKEKIKRADFVVDNSRTKIDTKNQLDNLITTLKE